MKISKICLLVAASSLAACGSPEEDTAPQNQADGYYEPEPLERVELDEIETPDVPDATLDATKKTSLTYSLMNTSQKEIGTITVEGNNKPGVKLTVNATSFPPGGHGIHFHVKADCSASDFTSAGGHINPENKQHGLKNEDGPDNADMPNAQAEQSGILKYSYTNDRVSLTEGIDVPALLDGDGSALVIHENPDDQMTQPIGGAGARIACAEIRKNY